MSCQLKKSKRSKILGFEKVLTVRLLIVTDNSEKTKTSIDQKFLTFVPTFKEETLCHSKKESNRSIMPNFFPLLMKVFQNEELLVDTDSYIWVQTSRITNDSWHFIKNFYDYVSYLPKKQWLN